MRARRMRRSRVRQLSGLSVNRMIPNVLTLLALCAGMTAIRFAIDGNFQAAVFSIIAAGVFDGLSDFVSFGVAPAAILYLWTMAALGSLGWAIVLVFAVCCGLRLARFNTQLGAELPAYAAPFFTGAPAPA